MAVRRTKPSELPLDHPLRPGAPAMVFSIRWPKRPAPSPTEEPTALRDDSSTARGRAAAGGEEPRQGPDDHGGEPRSPDKERSS